MISKLIGQSPNYYVMYEILRKLEFLTRVAPNIGWNTGTTTSTTTTVPVTTTTTTLSPTTTTTTSTATPFDADYQAVLTFATAQGYALPSQAQRVKQNQLVLALKAAGAWTLLDVLYIFATDGDSDFATLNWKNPALFQCLKVNSPIFTTNIGFRSNGTTSFVDTTWRPSDGVNYTQNNASAFYHTSSNIAASTVDIGTEVSTNTLRLYIIPRSPTDTRAWSVNGSGSSNGTSSNSIGFYLLDRVNSTQDRMSKDNGAFSTKAANSTGLSTRTLYVNALHAAGGAAANFSQRNVGCLGTGASIAAVQTDVFNAWTTYFTSL